MHKLFNIGFIVCLTFCLRGAELKILLTRVSSDTVNVSWNANQMNTEPARISIYIEEGYLTSFPRTKVDEIPGKAVLWQFVKRGSFNFLGLDLKKPDQISQKNIWTPGEPYTLGISIEYLDNLTLKPKTIEGFGYFLPFTTISGLEDLPPVIKEYSPEKGIGLLPVSSNRFIKNNIFDNLNGIRSEIIKIREYPFFFILVLENNQLVKYEKPPKRPEFLGAPLFVYALAGIFLIPVICLIFVKFMISFNANILSAKLEECNTSEEKAAMLMEILGRNKPMPVLSLYRLSVKKNYSFDKEGVIADTINSVYKMHKLYQYVQISKDIVKALGSVSFKNADSIITNNIIQVSGNKNIIVQNIKDSDIRLNQNE